MKGTNPMHNREAESCFILLLVGLVTLLVPERTAAQQKMPGLVVEAVATDSLGAKAGLKNGDRILTYDDRELGTPAAFHAAQENTFGKKELVLRVSRGEEILRIPAPPGSLGARVRPELPSAALTLYEDGNAKWKRKMPNEATVTLEAAANAARQAGDETSEAWLYGRIADVYESQRLWKQAREAHLRAWEILTELGDPAAQSHTLSALGRCSEYLEDFPAAERWFAQAMKVDTAAGFEMWVAVDLNSLAFVISARGDIQTVQDYLSRSLAIRERLDPNSLSVAKVLNNLGNVARGRGDLDAAKIYHCRALAIRERLAPNSADVATSLSNMGNLNRSLGDLDAAQEYHSRSLAIYERLKPNTASVAHVLNNLGALSFYRGNLDAAHDYNSRALAIRERLKPGSLDVAMSLNNLGDVALGRGELEAARSYYSRALAIREQRLAPNLQDVESLSGLGEVAFKEQRFSDARALFTRAVGIIETWRSKIHSAEARALFLAQHTKPFSGLLRVNIALNELPAAFATLERARARSLAELLTERRFDLRSGAPPDLVKKQDELDQKRSAAYAALARLEPGDVSKRAVELKEELRICGVRQRELEAEFRRTVPRFASLQYPEPLDFDQTRAALDEGTLALAYYVDQKQTYLFGLTSTSLKLLVLPVGEKSLVEMLGIFHQQLSGRRLGDPDEHGQKLYDLLIRPAQAWVDQATRVLICPDGPLQTLPFASLVSRPKPDVRYFIDDKPLHMIVSMTVYAQTRRQPIPKTNRETRVLAFGDPAYSNEDAVMSNRASSAKAEQENGHEKSATTGSDAETDYARRRGLKLNRLPHSRDEVEEIAKLFGKSATIKLGKQATEAAARSDNANYTIIHFAVHGWLDEQIGLNSGLALSRPEMLGREPTKEDNGLLQAWEIFNHLKLNADLVVLSGCDTGLGQSLRGEGLIGLTRALQYAGARSVVVSLWQVDDASTAVFMSAFYRELRKGASKDVALQRATAAVRHNPSNPKWGHPRYWSPFVLTGSWN
jgi:CHAT domain-containing protein/Tfp pilus assembly protein PilF